MKKRVNFALLMIFIISILLALKYSALPIWSQLPVTLKNWFTISNSELTELVFFYDLFIGISVSCIFYFFVEFIPNKIHIYESRKLLSYEIELLLRDMNFIICTIRYIFQIEVPIKHICEKNLLIINGKANIKKNGFYLEQVYSNKGIKKGKRITGVETTYEYPKCISSTLKSISDRLNNISIKEGFYSIDLQFAETIILLKDNKFINHYKDGEKTNVCFLFADTSKNLMEFINLYKILLKKNYHNRYMNFHYLSDEEINNRPKKLDDLFEFIEKRNDKLKKLNPCLIYNGLDSNSKIIANELTSIFGNEVYVYTESTIPMLINNNLIVVILGTGFLSEDKQYNEFLEKVDFKGKHVIVLKEYILKKNCKGLDIIGDELLSRKTFYFKSSIQIKSVYINKEYPTRDSISKINKYIYDFIDDFIK